MFTGIIQETAEVKEIERKPNFARFGIAIASHVSDPCTLGSSIAINGVCLTVAKINELIWFDIMTETLQKTNIGNIQEGERVNVERSAKMGDEIGGHVISGHVHTTAVVQSIDRIDEENTAIEFQLNDLSLGKFLFEKGFIAVNGASLTLTNVEKEKGTFRIYFIPHTLAQTTFGTMQVGDIVNIEVDQMTRTVVETVERVMSTGYVEVSSLVKKVK